MTSPALSRICCFDLDTFFVSVERLRDPTLVGRPVVVGGVRGSRGVVTAASYEVRRFGVRSGMSIHRATRLAPQAVFLPCNHDQYSTWSRRVMAMLGEMCPQVIPASIDEAYLDFSGCEGMYHQVGDSDADATIERVARAIRQRVQDELGLPASIGIGSTRPVAKMASALAKPAGVWMVRAGDEHDFVDPLPVRAFPGIGPVAEARLHEVGVFTLGQVIGVPKGPLRAQLGDVRKRVIAGLDGSRRRPRRRPAFREHDPLDATLGSISNERTFAADVTGASVVREQISALVQRVCWRLRRRAVRARTVGLKLRFSDFHTLTRSATIAATDLDSEVFDTAMRLFEAAFEPGRPVRLVGVQLSRLVGPQRQLRLFGRDEGVTAPVMDAVRERFGYGAIRLGSGGGRTGWQEDPSAGQQRRSPKRRAGRS